MALSRPQSSEEHTSLDLNALPACKLNIKADVPLQIAAHLRKTMDMYGTGSPVVLRVPSAMELSFFYHRSILDVLDGLFALKAQHYEYMLKGLDDVITLENPLARKNPARLLRKHGRQ